MKIINGSGQHLGSEFFVLDVDSEPTMIKLNTQADDMLICSRDGDVLVNWDMDEWNDQQCLMIRQFDNLKELGNLKCTKFMIKSADEDKQLKVYLTFQRN